jgi:hypothetical protein
MTQQSIGKGDALQRISSTGFILGAILIAASGLFMPRANTPTSDLQQMLKPLGEHEFLTQLSSLLIAIGFWIVSIPVIALGAIQVFVPRSITLTLIFSMLMMLTILWNLTIGIWVARRAW